MVKPVKAQTSESVKIIITSPVQNQVYPNRVFLNFTCEGSLVPINDGVLFVLNVDGEPGYHGGHGVRLGEMNYVPSFFNTTVNLPDGNHTIWVNGFFWVYGASGQITCIESLSQIVNFVVDSEHVSTSPELPSPSPTVPEISWSVILPLFCCLLFTAVIIRLQKTCRLFL
ncbi:MAG: hypothetical protein ACQCN3_01290 [Candidatus Bathyarchaeia archaeon]|jgi:hypothetical protein